MRDVGPLTEDEALLRVALLTARADGTPSTAEAAALERVLGRRMRHLKGPELQVLVGGAVAEVETGSPDVVLRRVKEALPTKAGRVLALQVACEIANADGRLAKEETQHLVALAAALGLSQHDVSLIVRSYW
jgi:tellurite resistance protein